MLYHADTLADADHDLPRRLSPTRELAVYLLTPGFSRAYHARALQVSSTTVDKYLRRVIKWRKATRAFSKRLGGT